MCAWSVVVHLFRTWAMTLETAHSISVQMVVPMTRAAIRATPAGGSCRTDGQSEARAPLYPLNVHSRGRRLPRFSLPFHGQNPCREALRERQSGRCRHSQAAGYEC